MKQLLFTVSVILLSGNAAGAAKVGGIEKKYMVTIPPAALKLGEGGPITNPNPHLLIRIEYPSDITGAGLDALTKAEMESGQFTSTPISAEVRARVLDGVNKSAYFAFRLYRALKASKYFPDNSIALDPVVIDGPEQAGQFVSSKHGSASVPAVITIRFAMQRNPVLDVTRDEGSRYTVAYQNTFADWVTPKFTILTEPLAWPNSGGLIATVGLGAAPFFSCPSETCLARSPEVGDLLATDRLTYVVEGAAVSGMNSLRDRLPYPNEVADKDAVFLCQDTPADVGPVCGYEQLIVAYARQSLRQVDPYLGSRFQWKRYIQQYDSRLAERWPGGAYDPASRARLSLLKQIMFTERAFLVSQSEKLANAGLNGVAGVTLRGQRQAERSYSESLRKANSGFSLASLLSMATTVSQFGQAFAAKDTSGQFSAIQAEMQRANKDAAIGAGASSKIESLFNNSILLTLEGDPQSQKVLGKTISSNSLSTLRRSLREVYVSQKLPALPSIAECRRNNENGAISISYGRCQVVPYGNQTEVSGEGFTKLVSSSFDYTIEFDDHFLVLDGNFSVVENRVKTMNLYEAIARANTYHDYKGMTTYCLIAWDQQRVEQERVMTRCRNQPDLFNDGAAATRTLTRLESSLFEQRISAWRGKTQQLIQSEIGQ